VLLAGWSPVLNEIDVEPAVVVEVEERDTRAHDLRHEVPTGGTGIVGEKDTGFLCDVLEPRGRNGEDFRLVWRRGLAAQNETGRQERPQSAQAIPKHAHRRLPLVTGNWLAHESTMQLRVAKGRRQIVAPDGGTARMDCPRPSDGGSTNTSARAMI